MTVSSVAVASGSNGAAVMDESRRPGLLDAVRQSKREKQIVAWVQEQYQRCKNDRNTVERQWYLNLAFYFGRQNVQFLNTSQSANGFKLITPKAPPWRVRLVVNKIRPIIRTELAKVTAQKPRFTVVPATSEDEDQVSARVSEQIFDTVYSEKEIKKVIKRAEWWTLICGTGFIKDYWDKNKEDKVNKAKGDLCYEPVSPFHIFVPNLREEDIENQPYVMHAVTKSTAWAVRAFPKLQGLDLSTTESASDILDDAFMNMIGVKNRRSEEVLVLEVWIKPGRTNILPNGGVITLVGDHLASVVESYPYEHGDYPFTKLEHIPSGKFYAESVVTDLIPLQREYNRTRSQIIEAKNLMGKPKMMAPKGSVNPNQVTSEPGQWILYIPGFDKPTPVPLPQIPQYMLNEIQQLQQDMDDLAGQHEISRGQNPSQVTAATALSFLKEQDDTKLSATIESLESGIEKIGRHTLSHVTQFWGTPRLVRVVGADGTFEAQLYNGKAIKGNLDVRVEAGSALPQSKAAKQAFLMDLMKLGLIPPEKGLEMLDIGGIEKVYEDHLTDVRQAQRENLKMVEGLPVEPNDFDNHAVHIEIHNKFRKGQQFEALPDNLKVLFQTHVQAHQVAVQTGLLPGGVVQPPLPGMEGAGNGSPVGMGGPSPENPLELPPEGPVPAPGMEGM